jgi:hypothetical protein
MLAVVYFPELWVFCNYVRIQQISFYVFLYIHAVGRHVTLLKLAASSDWMIMNRKACRRTLSWPCVRYYPGWRLLFQWLDTHLEGETDSQPASQPRKNGSVITTRKSWQVTGLAIFAIRFCSFNWILSTITKFKLNFKSAYQCPYLVTSESDFSSLGEHTPAWLDPVEGWDTIIPYDLHFPDAMTICSQFPEQVYKDRCYTLLC